MCDECLPVLQVVEIKGSAAGTDVAVLVHVHLVLRRYQAVRPYVKLAATDQQGLLNVLLDHPLRPSPVYMPRACRLLVLTFVLKGGFIDDGTALICLQTMSGSLVHTPRS